MTTEPSIDEQDTYVPPTVDEMFFESGPTDEQRGAYSTLLERLAYLEAENLRKGSELEDWNRTSERLSRKHTANRMTANAGLKVLAELAYLMPDAEFHPKLTVMWDDSIDITFINRYGSFELTGDDEKRMITIIPADKSRNMISFDLDEDGVPATTVLMIKGHLGLPDDGQLTDRADAILRNKRSTSAAAPSGLISLMELLGGSMPDCGDRNCPIHNGQLSSFFGGANQDRY